MQINTLKQQEIDKRISIEELQAQIKTLKQQDIDKRISKVKPKYEGKFFKCSYSYMMHIIKVVDATDDGKAINIYANELNLKTFGVSIDMNVHSTISVEYLHEITEEEFRQSILKETSNIIEQL